MLLLRTQLICVAPRASLIRRPCYVHYLSWTGQAWNNAVGDIGNLETLGNMDMHKVG